MKGGTFCLSEKYFRLTKSLTKIRHKERFLIFYVPDLSQSKQSYPLDLPSCQVFRQISDQWLQKQQAKQTSELIGN